MSLQEIIIGVLLIIIGMILEAARKKVTNFFRERRTNLKPAPSDILKFLRPGVSIPKVKEVLGTPANEYGQQLIFKLKNLHIQITQKDRQIETITLLLPKLGFFNKYDIYPLDLTLGKSTIRDIVSESSTIQYETSSKHGLMWIESYYGNPGYYNYYTFGIFDGPSAIYPNEFPELHVSNKNLSKRVKGLKFNLLSISSVEGKGPFVDFHSLR